jgi:hypothetical protein
MDLSRETLPNYTRRTHIARPQGKHQGGVVGAQ